MYITAINATMTTAAMATIATVEAPRTTGMFSPQGAARNRLWLREGSYRLTEPRAA
jgi:hypothetical protein